MTSLRKKVYLFKAAPEEDDLQNLSSSSTVHGKEDTTVSCNNSGDTGLPRGDGVEKKENIISGKEEEGTSRDRFITLLNSEEGLQAKLVPVVVFIYSNLDELWRHIKSPGGYAGMIFTSQRCVYALEEAMKNVVDGGEIQWETHLRGEWASKHMFSVGPSTTAKVQELFSLQNNGDEDSLKIIQGMQSHAESLADKIMEVFTMNSLDLPLLYPCGAQRRDVLQKKLNDAHIQCVQSVVYETVENPGLPSMLQNVSEELHKCQSFLCFFSPSGVKCVFQHLDVATVTSSQSNFVAIGGTTKAALEEALLASNIPRVVHTCQTPTPEALLEIVRNVKD